MNAPVVMIGYSRISTLDKSLRRLSECDGVRERDLYLYLDAPYRNDDCEKCEGMYRAALFAKSSFLPSLEIIRRDRNYGVPGNLLAAVQENLNRYGRVIFFEDDVCVSRTFLKYMDAALTAYENDKRIFCVNGHQTPYLRIPRNYPHDIYLNLRNMAWGFGTWRDRWECVDFTMQDWDDFKSNVENLEKLASAGADLKNLIEAQLSGRIHTWDVQCTYHMVKNGLYAIEPRKGLTKNIGVGDYAVHCRGRNAAISHQKYYEFLPHVRANIQPDERMLSQFRYALVDSRPLHRVWRKLLRMWWSATGDHDEPIKIRG